MRALVVAAIVSLLLAGCSDGGGPPPEETPEPAPVAKTGVLPVEASAYIQYRGGCLPNVCIGGSPQEAAFLDVPDNASVTGVSLQLGDPGPLGDRDEPVDWELWCDTDGVVGCGRPLAEGTDTLPFSVEATGLALPLGVRLELLLVGASVDPLLNIAPELLAALAGPVEVTGQVQVEWVPEENLPVPIVEVVDVSVDGHSGPCSPTDTDCPSWPGGSEIPIGLEGIVVGANLTMTWTSTSELDRELQLVLYPAPGPFCRFPCPPSVEVAGPSPLVLGADGLKYAEGGVRLEVSHVEPAAGIGSWVGTRTPVHIEGQLFVQTGVQG